MRILEAMKADPNAPYCSICGRQKKKCLKQAVAVVCSNCTYNESEKYVQSRAAKPCEVCGKEVPGWSTSCPNCDKKAQKARGRPLRGPRATISKVADSETHQNGAVPGAKETT